MSIESIGASPGSQGILVTSGLRAELDRRPFQAVPSNAAKKGAPDDAVQNMAQSPQVQPIIEKSPQNDQERVKGAVEKISSFVSKVQPEISFSIDQASGSRVVRIMDSESKQIIRQIPSEEAIELAQALERLQGLFVRDKA